MVSKFKGAAVKPLQILPIYTMPLLIMLCDLGLVITWRVCREGGTNLIYVVNYLSFFSLNLTGIYNLPSAF